MGWTLVTGSAKRLGAQICKTLASKGYPVVIHYNKSEKEAEDVVAECRKFKVAAECIQGDLSSIESTKDFLERYLKRFPDTINLINNVGNYLVCPPLKTEIEDWQNLFQTNLYAPFILIQGLAPSIIKNQGSIINVGTSKLEAQVANSQSTAYQTTKLSLLLLTRSLAKELASDQVRVNMVSPGQLNTSVNLPKDVSVLPMKRAGTEVEVARVIAFLLEKDSAYITGQNIEVAGGLGL